MSVVLLLLAAAGCRTKSLFKVPNGHYRVETVADAGAVLLAPPVPSRYHPDQPLQVLLTIPGNYGVRKAGCAVREGAFALLPAGRTHRNTLKLVLPPLQEWLALLNAAQNAKESEQIRSSLNRFIESVDHLAGQGCLPQGIGEPIRSLVLQTIPLQPQQSLYNFCEYWIGNGVVDLKPHLRLKVQRVYLEDNTQSASASHGGRYLGTSTVYFTIAQLRSQLFRLQKGKLNIDSVAGRKSFEVNSSDLSLAESVKPMPVHRLILFTEFVSQRIKRPALILSAKTSKALDNATASIQADPGRSCFEVEKRNNVNCVSFFGDVTVSPEIQIYERGNPKYVPFGTRLSAELQPSAYGNHAFQLRRLFQQQYAEVELPPGDASANDMTLVGGDKIVWK